MGSLADKSIYAMRHNVTKRIYIGCSVHFEKRIREHISHLRNGTHDNVELQKDYDLYGEDYSYFVIERNVQFSRCFDREREWQCILKTNEIETGYNLAKKETPPTIEDFFKVEVKIGNPKKKQNKERDKKESNPRRRSFLRLDSLVKARNITLYKVAKELGIARSVFSEWKSGKSMPKTEKLLKIADYFGVSIEYFLE